MGDGRELHLLDHFLFVERAGQVVFIGEHEHWNPDQRGPAQKLMQLGAGHINIPEVCGVHHVNDRVHASAVFFPAVAEARLAAQVPDLHLDAALLDLAQVESDGRDCFRVELARREHVDERGLARVLQSHH